MQYIVYTVWSCIAWKRITFTLRIRVSRTLHSGVSTYTHIVRLPYTPFQYTRVNVLCYHTTTNTINQLYQTCCERLVIYQVVAYYQQRVFRCVHFL